MFNFDNTFEIHDDIEVLKRMGMAMGLERGECPPEKLSLAKSMVPKALEPYVRRMSFMFSCFHVTACKQDFLQANSK